MKAAICVLLLLALSNNLSGRHPDLDFVRSQYEKAPGDRHVCEAMIAELSKHTQSSVHLAYLGGYQAIWAKHASNVFSKLNTFNKGKKNIEQAVKQNGVNVEIRMIRLSIQKNCPAFLGYHDNIIQDREYLEKHKNTVHSSVLLRIINGLLED